MGKSSQSSRLQRMAFFSSLVLLSSLLFTNQVNGQAQDPSQPQEQYCLSCHGNPDIELTMPSGEKLSLFISAEAMEQSVHGSLGLDCRACHPSITTFPHPPINFQDSRELSHTYYEACEKCHSENYQRAQDSIHAAQARNGNLQAPVCSDCHGAHDTLDPDLPRALVSETCGQCHTEVFQTYQKSVHGTALIEEDNPDVPVCTDCHGVHNIQDPRTGQFHVETPELCAGCHANQVLMEKYGLSADVYNIYKLSWHGVDVSVFEANWPTIWHTSAVCTDCHGTHDIFRTADAASHVNPANLLGTCKQCHPQAGPNWVDAWTGHHEVSLERTPFVFYTQVFYNQFAYVVLWASAIYVLLQILRATAARIRRSLQ